MEKNGVAQFIDKLMEGIAGARKPATDNIVKPYCQEIGDGIIVWRWDASETSVEAVLATREHNQINLEKDRYLVSVKMPESDNYTYTLMDDVAKQIGEAITSAYQWQFVWKQYAGDFLLEQLSQEPEQPSLPAPELFEPAVREEEEPLQG